MKTTVRMFLFELTTLWTILLLHSGIYCSVVLNPGPLAIDGEVGLRQLRRLSVADTDRGHVCQTPTPVKSRFRQYDPNMSVFIIPVEKPREDKAFKAWGGKRKVSEGGEDQSLEWMESNVNGYPNWLKDSALNVKKSSDKTVSQEDPDSSQMDNSNESKSSVVMRRKGGHKFLSWGGKRSEGSFGQWGGKRSDDSIRDTGLVKRTGSFNNWGGKRSYNSSRQ